jgi:hypothetical protein
MVAALLAGALALGGIGAVGVACAPASQPRATNQAVQDVQALLDSLIRARNTTYTAAYATQSGVAVVVAQAPPRYAYQGGSGAYLLTPDVAYLCRQAPPGCQPSPGADAVSPSQARAISAALGGVFLPVEAVAAQMSAVAAQPGTRTSRASRSVAGAPAECVAAVPSAGPGLLACVNSAGILVFFAGTSEEGATVRMELQRFSPTVAPDAFKPPAPVS